MKVVFVNTYPTSINWGVEVVTGELMAGLRKKGVETELVSLSAPELRFLEGLRFKEKFLINHLLLRALRGKLKGADIVHFNAYNSYVASLIHPSKKPTVVTLHGSSYGLHRAIGHSMPFLRRWYSENVIERMERTGARACNRVVCVSESVRQQAIEGYGIEPEKISVIHNAVALPKPTKAKKQIRRELGISTDATVLLAVGRGDYTKGVDMLLPLAKRLHEKYGAHLLLAGSLTNHWRHKKHGWLTVKRFARSEIANAYAASDLYLHTSRYEGFGISLLEAMGCGLPAVSFHSGVAPEIIRNGKNGVLVKNFDMSEFEKAVNYLIERPRMREKIGKEAKRTVAKNFTVEKMASSYLKVYKKLL